MPATVGVWSALEDISVAGGWFFSAGVREVRLAWQQVLYFGCLRACQLAKLSCEVVVAFFC